MLTEAQLAAALKTRVGGRSTDKTKVKYESTSVKATHEQNSRSSMTLASDIWAAGGNESIA